MIGKPYTPKPPASDRRAQAGADAEDPEVHVLHDLRLVDPAQPEQTGQAGACQIDHLIIHRWGMFIVESKSVTSEVRIRPDGSGGDEWTRVWDGTEKGMPSPIRQAKRQGEFLRTYLRRHETELLGKLPLGLRTIGKAVAGSDQRGFRHLPAQLIVAVSDSGRIQRLDGWHEPEKPFRVFVTKADAAPEKIASELKRHRKGASLLSVQSLTGDYGIWSMSAEEAGNVARFLSEHHTEQSDAATPTTTEDTAQARCKHCASGALSARWGRRGGYYWNCQACGQNTRMPTTCRTCGTVGHRGQKVRIRKARENYFRKCEEQIWTEPQTQR